MVTLSRSLAAVSILVSACGSNPPGDPLALTTLTDVNADPSIVEVNLVAAPARATFLPGKPADVWAFRDGSVDGAEGSVPGPMIEANQGDRVIVHFRNDLPDATTIHWHGVRVPNASDGTPVAQVPIPSGGTYDYEFVAKDAGLFWYHPHVDGEVQVERGLYAPILVHGGPAIDVAADRVFVLDDVKLEASGALSTTTDNLDMMLGRQGNVVLVNGTSDGVVRAAAGTRERWRFVNAANGRYFNLSLGGRPLTVIGWDGGLVSAPYETTTLLVAPGERYDVLVDLGGAPGDALELDTVYYDRGHDLPDPGPIKLLAIELGAAGPAPAALPISWGDVAPLPVNASTPEVPFVLTEEDTSAEPRFLINGQAYPDVTPLTATRGTLAIWRLDNQSEMDHPFHLHGMSFQPLDASGAPVTPLGWKDTINVPMKSVVRVAVQYDAPGTWMFHCHILEHADRGMMGELVVAPPP